MEIISFSAVLVFRKKQIKTTLRYHYIPTRKAVTKQKKKKKKEISSIKKDVKNLKTFYITFYKLLYCYSYRMSNDFGK